MSMDERYNNWKNKYNDFIENFNAKAYIYYINTLDAKRNRHYRTIISIIPKNAKNDEILPLLNAVDIEGFIKKEFESRFKEQENSKNK